MSSRFSLSQDEDDEDGDADDADNDDDVGDVEVSDSTSEFNTHTHTHTRMVFHRSGRDAHVLIHAGLVMNIHALTVVLSRYTCPHHDSMAKTSPTRKVSTRFRFLSILFLSSTPLWAGTRTLIQKLILVLIL